MLIANFRASDRFKAIVILFFLISVTVTEQAFGAVSEQDTTQSILIRKDKRSDLEKLVGGEQAEVNNFDRIYLPGGDSLPNYSAEQDSLYFRAMRAKIPQYTRFAMELQEVSSENAFVEAVSNSPWSIALRNLAAIPAEAYTPNPVDVTNHQNNINQAFYVPLVPTLMSGGLRVSMNTIGRILGLVEDISPTISYKLDVACEVEVVVYSIQAYVVQTIFKGTQQSGAYSFTWNKRNDKGKLMPPGDYIIEARIGKYRIQRKRTVI